MCEQWFVTFLSNDRLVQILHPPLHWVHAELAEQPDGHGGRGRERNLVSVLPGDGVPPPPPRVPPPPQRHPRQAHPVRHPLCDRRQVHFCRPTVSYPTSNYPHLLHLSLCLEAWICSKCTAPLRKEWPGGATWGEAHLYSFCFSFHRHLLFWAALTWARGEGDGEGKSNETFHPPFSPQSHDCHRLSAAGSSRHVVLRVLPPGRPAAPRRDTQARWRSEDSTPYKSRSDSDLDSIVVAQHKMFKMLENAANAYKNIFSRMWPFLYSTVPYCLWSSSLPCVDTRVRSLGSSSKQREDWDAALQVQNKTWLLRLASESVV